MTCLDKSQEIIFKHIVDFVINDPGNAMPAHGGMTIYDAPLIGVARADDGLFDRLKDPEVIGTEHLSPQDWLPGTMSVVSYFLPHTTEVRKSNYAPGLPSEVLLSARIDGEAFNDTVRRSIIRLVEEMGGKAIAPRFDSRFKVQSNKSNWSERHVAWIAGLGTFGLHRTLITAKGCSGRLGSVITTLKLHPTPRAYSSHYEYCLYLNNGSCGLCVERCASGAMSLKGKDKEICRHHIFGVIKPRFDPRYGCDKCQTSVPCEGEIPGC